MTRLISCLRLPLIFVLATRADAALIAWDLELSLTDAGTEPVPGLFVRDETSVARIAWDAEATFIQQSTSRREDRDLIVWAGSSSAGKEIDFGVASASDNGGTMLGQPSSASDRFDGALVRAGVTGSVGGQPFTSPFASDIRFFLYDLDTTAFDDLDLPVDPRPLCQFEVRGLALDIPGPVGSVRQTNFSIQNVSVSIVPEPGTGLLVALGLAGLTGWRRRMERRAAGPTADVTTRCGFGWRNAHPALRSRPGTRAPPRRHGR